MSKTAELIKEGCEEEESTASKRPRTLLRQQSSVLRFEALENKLVGFNADNLHRPVAVDTAAVPWVQSQHCMNCYLGQRHECWDPGYARDMETIKRKVFFVGNGETAFQIEDKKRPGEAYAVVSYIVQYAPGTPSLPHHDHPYGEEYLVLRGSFSDDLVQAPAGTYVKYPKDTEHHATPDVEDGAEILTFWGQNDNSDEALPRRWWGESTVSTGVQAFSTAFVEPGEPGSFWDCVAEGVWVLSLFKARRGNEETFMVRLRAGEEWERTINRGGLELFVLSGSCVDIGSGGEGEDLVYSAGWWARLPSPAEDDPNTSSLCMHLVADLDGDCTALIKCGHLH